MIIKGIIDEDFTNYKKPSMYIAFSSCDFKCDREAGCSICQNSQLALEPDIDINTHDIVQRYLNNPITKAIVMSGLDPLDERTQATVAGLVLAFREYLDDDIVIYTGYTEEEYNSIDFKVIRKWLKRFPNIIIKFGRFIPNQEKHYDEVLGVDLASPNQYARRIS